MTAFRCLAPVLLLALAGCGVLSSGPPASLGSGNTVTEWTEGGGRFIALVGPRRQHAQPFLGVPGTNFYALRSWLDTRTGEQVTQLYVENSYFGAERNWQAARLAAGAKLRFIPIGKNEITCDNGCSYAEEFGADLPLALLQASPQGLTVAFTAKSGAEMTIAVPGELVEKQLAALAAARARVPTAAVPAPPPPVQRRS
jgi:hypothetical protein